VNAPAKGPTVSMELDSVEADIECLTVAMQDVMDVAFTDKNHRTAMLRVLEKLHEVHFSLRYHLDGAIKDEQEGPVPS
jgi:hypothetical protein